MSFQLLLQLWFNNLLLHSQKRQTTFEGNLMPPLPANRKGWQWQIPHETSLNFIRLLRVVIMYRSNRSFNTLTPLPSREEGIWLSESSGGWGIWSPCFRGGGFELHPRFHVKSLAWRAIMEDAVLEDFRGKDCAFVASWLCIGQIEASTCPPPRAFDFFENYCSNSPLPGPKCCSNTPR